MKIDPATASPRAVEAHLRGVILKALGDSAENSAVVNASRGYFYVEISDPLELKVRFRRKNIERVVKAIRALRG